MSCCVLVFWGCSCPLSDPSRGSPRATSDRLPPLRGGQTKGGAVLILRGTRAPPNEAADLPVQSEVFKLVKAGKIVSEPRQIFALAEAADAHRALESRATTGATVLVP